MIFKAYFDESGTHKDSPVTIMAAVMGNERQLEQVEASFEAAKRRHGFNTFHMRKFKRRQGDFKGWSKEKCNELGADFTAMAWDHAFTEAVALILDNAAYEKEYLAGKKPRKLRLDSKYGLCFRECLMALLFEARKRRLRSRLPELHVIVESGHKNAGDVDRIFHEIKEEYAGTDLDLLKTITFAKKDECNPLMIADFLAHTNFEHEVEIFKGNRNRWPARVLEKGGCLTILHDADSLKKTRQVLERKAAAMADPSFSGQVRAF